jgi:MFS family permease
MDSTTGGKPSPYSGESPSSKLMPSTNRYSIFFFCAVNLLWWACLYIYVPILPVYIQSSGAHLNMVGTILSAYAIPQVLLRIPIGVWSDRLGRRKPLIAVGAIVTALGALGLGLSATPWWLFLSRMTTGVGAATWVVFPIYFAAYYPAEDSGRAIGLINFIRSVALIAATAGGGFMAEELGLRQPFFMAALFGLLALVALLFTKEQPLPRAQTASWRSFLLVATRPLLLTISVIGIMLHFAIFTGLFSFLPIYAEKIGASNSEIGLITMINLGFSALGSLVAVWVWEKLGYRTAIILGAVITGISLLAIPFTPEVTVLMAIQVSFGLGNGVLMTVLMALSIRDVSREQQATAMGVYQALYAIGMLTGPLVSGFLGAGLGLSAVFYLAAAFSLLISILAFLPVFPRRTTA